MASDQADHHTPVQQETDAGQDAYTAARDLTVIHQYAGTEHSQALTEFLSGLPSDTILITRGVAGRKTQDEEQSTGRRQETAFQPVDALIRPAAEVRIPQEVPSLGPPEQRRDLETTDVRIAMEATRRRLRPARPPVPFFGYKQDLTRAISWLARHGIILVQGEAGAGKSAFLAKIADEWLQENTKDDIFWIDLDEGLTTTIQIVDELAKALGYSAILYARDDRKLQILPDLLSPDAAIIVLDNVKTAKQAKAVREFAAVVPRLLIGCRDGLRLSSERTINLAGLEMAAAITLLRHYAGSGLSEDESRAICETLSFCPGPIERAGRSIRERAGQMVHDVTERGRASKSGNMQTQRRAIADTYLTLLSNQERFVFDTFGAFAEKGAPESALARAAGLTKERLQQVLIVLERHGLVRQDPDTTIFSLYHPEAYEFAHGNLRRLEEERRMEEGVSFIATPSGRAMAYYVSYAKRHEEELAKLEAARDNLIRTITFATQMKDLDAVHGLWESLGRLALVNRRLGYIRRLEDWALQANWELSDQEPTAAPQLALILRDRSDLLDTVGDQIGALDDATEACQLAERSGDPKAMIAALVGMASLLARNPDKTNEQRSLLETAWRLLPQDPRLARARLCRLPTRSQFLAGRSRPRGRMVPAMHPSGQAIHYFFIGISALRILRLPVSW